MKTKIIIAIAIALFISGCVVDQIPNDLDRVGLKGSVKSLRCDKYFAEVKFGEVEKGRRDYNPGELENNSFTSFDENGNKILQEYFDESGELVFDSYYIFDDNRGVLIEWFRFIGSDNSTPRTHEFDSLGNLIETNLYQSNPSDPLDTNYYLNMRWKYKYDDKGNKIELICYYGNGQAYNGYSYKYDENGFLIEAIEKSTFMTGSLDFFIRRNYTNNDKGDKTNENSVYYDGRTLSMTHKYSYDKHGNWIKRIDYENQELRYICFREIEYYE